MYITINDAIEFVKDVKCNFDCLEKIKFLDQSERKLVLAAIKVSKSDTISSVVREIGEQLGQITSDSDPEFTALKDRIENKRNFKGEHKHSNFFVAFLKGIANLFSIRVSSSRVLDAVQNLKKKMDVNDF